MKDVAVLAYSGGLDTSVAIKWIQEKYKLDVITVTLDVGQKEDLGAIEEKAKGLGVLKHYSIDAKEEFIKNYVFPAIKANALYEGKYPISTALSRPLIASKLVEIATKEKACAVAHGCTGKGNDQVRFEVTIKSLAPDLKIIAPIREWKLARDEEIKFAKSHGIPVPTKPESPYSVDQNLWGRSIECGKLDYPEHEPPEEVFEWTNSPENALKKSSYIEVEFEEGVPKRLNGEKLNPVSLVEKLNAIGGEYGIGRIDHMENRLVGIKSREVYECPAATLLIEAHKDLEKIVLSKHELAFKQYVDTQWAYLAYNGLWLEPLKEDLDAFIEKSQERVFGKVRIKLYAGGLSIVGRSSPYSLYDLNLATYDIRTTFDQSWSKGFIEVWGLPTVIANILKSKIERKRKKV